ncbi:MAG: acetate--CoA ligase family protein [Coprothermobacterota bacterium]|nr:acetate--CoA ligase family protein [Coprothermobacterota bacterium]
MKLEAIFNPRSIAVIGASRKEGSIGYMVVKGLLDSQYQGKIFPVNPNADEILGLKCYKAATEIPEDVDLAVLTVPAAVALQAVEDAGKKGVKAVAVITSGFGEVGRKDLEEELVNIAHRYNMYLVGPNIVGILNNPAKANASFGPYLPYPGPIALVSQSGALLIALDGMTWINKIGISHMISIGNMADLDFADFIDALNEDPNTTCISLYIEGVKDGRKFLESARRSRKPIVALKAGVSQRGELATASHTGSLAGSSKVYTAAFEQYGIVPARSLDELFTRSIALSMMKPLMGDHVAVITNGGGAGVLATDAAERHGIPLTDPPEDLKNLFRKWMPDFGSPRNPVDMTGMADRPWYQGCLLDALNHPWTDGAAILYCETSITDPQNIAEGLYEAYVQAGAVKPIVVSFIGGERCVKAGEWLKSKGIPTYFDPDDALSALSALRHYGKCLERKDLQFHPHPVDKEKVREILAKVKLEGRTALMEYEAGQIFKAYGLPLASSILATNPEEAVKAAEEIGYPVVLKISSPDIIHKTEAKGVKINLKNAEDVKKAFEEIIVNARKYKTDARIVGVLVQKMASPGGTEVIFGAIRDPQFQQVVMFGLGGIFVEVLKDVTFRVAPVTVEEAKKMALEIQAASILKGVRGQGRRDLDALAESLSRLSQLVVDFPEIKELDANPVMLYESGLVVVDARILL